MAKELPTRARRRAAVRPHLLAFLAALAAASPLHAAKPAEADPASCPGTTDAQLVVRVHGVRSAAGTVTVVLYGDNPADFLARGKRLDRRRVPAREGTVDLCLDLPRPGTYAVALYHDEDADRRLTRNFVGLPTEGYGFSRDAETVLGLPSFEEVAFAAGTGTTALDIRMRY